VPLCAALVAVAMRQLLRMGTVTGFRHLLARLAELFANRLTS
jgi:hypothetical protein